MNKLFSKLTQTTFLSLAVLAFALVGCKKYHADKHSEQELAYKKAIDAYNTELSALNNVDGEYDKWVTENITNANAKSLIEEVKRVSTDHKKKKADTKSILDAHTKLQEAHKSGDVADAEVDKQYETMMGEVKTASDQVKSMGAEYLPIAEKKKNLKPATKTVSKPTTKVVKKR